MSIRFTRLRIKLWIRLFIGTSTFINNPTRSALAILCLAITMATMMIMMALQSGATLQMKSVVNDNGDLTFAINSGTVRALPNRGAGISVATSLNFNDLSSLQTRLPQINKVIPTYERGALLEFRGLNTSISVIGANADYQNYRNFDLDHGRFVDNLDLAEKSRVVVLGQTVVNKLFGDKQSMVLSEKGIVGQKIEISGVPFSVIGLLKMKGDSPEGMDLDNVAIIPLSTAMRRLDNVDYLTRVFIQAPLSSERTSSNGRLYRRSMPLSDQVRSLLDENHGIESDAERDFDIINPLRSNEFNSRSSGFVSVLFKLFVIITSLVAGAGIVGVTWLNIKERRSEFGLRKALGARWNDISLLIMVETVLLGVSGGLAGVIFGTLGIYCFQFFTQWELVFELRNLLVPLLGSIMVTLIVSAIPVTLACRMNTVDALANR